MQEFLARIQVPRIVIFGDWRGLHERHKGPRPRGKNRNRPLKWPQMLSKVNGYREIVDIVFLCLRYIQNLKKLNMENYWWG